MKIFSNVFGVFNPAAFGFGFVAILILIGAVVFAQYAAPTPGGGGSSNPATHFSCDVGVDEKLVGQFNIESLSCRVTKVSQSCGFSLALFSEKGNLQVVDSTGVIVDKNFETPIIGDHVTVTVSDCTYDDKITIRLLNDEGNLVESREAVLQ